MKIYHFVLIFLIFFLAAMLKTDINVGKMEEVEKEKTELTDSLYTAVSDAVECIADSGSYGNDSINRDKVEKTFFTSLYSSLGIMADTEAQEQMALYIPVLLLCDSDGFYLSYYDDYKDSDGNTCSKRIWSEKTPYYYQDEAFIYRFTLTDLLSVYDDKKLLPENALKNFETDYHEFQSNGAWEAFRITYSDSFLLHDEAYELTKKAAILNQLEEMLSYYTNRHNRIARQHGITYNFSFPAGKEKEWAEYMDDVNLMVVFQGYPYGADKDYTFNKVASAGANVIKKTVYYVEEKSWYKLAHKAGCPKLDNNPNVYPKPFDSLEECAKLGAYCDECIDNGPRAPKLK